MSRLPSYDEESGLYWNGFDDYTDEVPLAYGEEGWDYDDDVWSSSSYVNNRESPLEKKWRLENLRKEKQDYDEAKELAVQADEYLKQFDDTKRYIFSYMSHYNKIPFLDEKFIPTYDYYNEHPEINKAFEALDAYQKWQHTLEKIPNLFKELEEENKRRLQEFNSKLETLRREYSDVV